MDENAALESLLEQLSVQKEAVQETSRKVDEILARQPGSRSIAIADEPFSPRRKSRRGLGSPRSSVSQSVADRTAASEFVSLARHSSTGLVTFNSSSNSRRTGEDSDEDDDESFYVQSSLEPQQYDHEDFRKHLQEYEWDEHGMKILDSIVNNPSRMRRRQLFPDHRGPVEDRSNYTAYQVFDVGSDGAPIPVDTAGVEHSNSRALAIWHTIKEVNPPGKGSPAVGRITIVREPSPILFGAVHFTTHKFFDTDELFEYLVSSGASSAHMHRAFDRDPRKQSSYAFSFEYFTLIGEDCQPMQWQLADRQTERKPGHIAITRCSAVVALALSGKPIRKVKNPARRAETSHGYVYDPWASWQVLNLQCFPDWNSTTDTHDSTKHYVNGVEAFMVTLLGEYMDAERRFEKIYDEIKRLITPPLEFMFDSALRDKLLFEDGEFTYSRRYFWAYQTLGIMIDSIHSLIDAYQDTFTDEVYEGKHKTLWPLIEEEAPRNRYFRRRMAVVNTKFQVQIAKLQKLIGEYEARRNEIRALRDQLFSGTSVLESRKSVEMSEITVQQGHNIKLLTLVSIFFLPLTFVTSVFGMTNMPTEHHFTIFALVTTTVCVPFFVLVGSLNSTRGIRFWRSRSNAAIKAAGSFIAWIARGAPREPPKNDEEWKEASSAGSVTHFKTGADTGARSNVYDLRTVA